MLAKDFIRNLIESKSALRMKYKRFAPFYALGIKQSILGFRKDILTERLVKA